MKWYWILAICVGSIFLIGLIGLLIIARPMATQTLAVVPINETTPTVAAEALAATTTEAPTIVATTAVSTSTPAPIAIVCDTPSIKTSLNGSAFKEFSEYLDTNLGRRMTYTSRKLLVPDKAWNIALTTTELKTVENTWQDMEVCVPDGMTGRVFAGGFEQGSNRYENGVLMTLQPGLYDFNLRNAEVVIWYQNQDSFAAKDLDRIIAQIRVGNFDIKAPLTFFGVTTDLLPQIPADLVKERNVQIVSFPEASTK